MLPVQDRLTKRLYLGKVSDFQTCPYKYYLKHHLHIGDKQEPTKFKRGNAYHEVIRQYLAHGKGQAVARLLTLPEQTEEDKALLLKMLEAFIQIWEVIDVKKIITIEHSIQYPISHLTEGIFTNWVIKPDFIFETNTGQWVADHKTTSGYGAATSKYYHDSPQTSSYFYIVNDRYPETIGTKIFVNTTKNPRCFEETILSSRQKKLEAELFIRETCEAMSHAENEQRFPRNMTKCVSVQGGECPYAPICLTGKNEQYISQLVNEWYVIKNPDDHLELGED